MRDYKYIIFDVDGTLLNYELSERGAFYRTAAICGFDADEDTYQMYTHICDSVWEKYDLDNTEDSYIQNNYHDLYRIYAAERFEKLADELRTGKTPGELNRIYFQEYKEVYCPEPYAAEVCKKLGEKYELVIATNGLEEIQVPRIAVFRDFVSGIFVSDTAGAPKPSPRFFNCMCEHLGITDPGECLMVGDSIKNDIAGAARSGMGTCWYHPGKATATGDIVPDHEITSLMELLEIL